MDGIGEYSQTKSHVYRTHIDTTITTNNNMGTTNALAFSNKTNQASSFITVACLQLLVLVKTKDIIYSSSSASNWEYMLQLCDPLTPSLLFSNAELCLIPCSFFAYTHTHTPCTHSNKTCPHHRSLNDGGVRTTHHTSQTQQTLDGRVDVTSSYGSTVNRWRKKLPFKR